jgi:hypothetical protein
LVAGLLPLVVPAAHARAALTAHGVDLVDEDDAGSVLLALLEQVADPAGADTDEHLDEVTAGDGEERHPGLAGDGSGEEGLAGSRRPHQQHALGDATAEAGELAGILEELDDLDQLLLGLVRSGDVLEGDLPTVIRQQLRAGLAEAHGLAAADLELTHDQQEQDQEQHHRQGGGQHRDQPAVWLRLVVGNDVVLIEDGEEVVALGRPDGLEARAVGQDA